MRPFPQSFGVRLTRISRPDAKVAAFFLKKFPKAKGVCPVSPFRTNIDDGMDEFSYLSVFASINVGLAAASETTLRQPFSTTCFVIR
jgi:hypothetical protein